MPRTSVRVKNASPTKAHGLIDMTKVYWLCGWEKLNVVTSKKTTVAVAPSLNNLRFVDRHVWAIESGECSDHPGPQKLLAAGASESGELTEDRKQQQHTPKSSRTLR